MEELLAVVVANRPMGEDPFRPPGEGQGANDLYLRGLQFDAHTDDLWLAFVCGKGEIRPVIAERQANMRKAHENLLESGSKASCGLAGDKFRLITDLPRKYPCLFQHPANEENR